MSAPSRWPRAVLAGARVSITLATTLPTTAFAADPAGDAAAPAEPAEAVPAASTSPAPGEPSSAPIANDEPLLAITDTGEVRVGASLPPNFVVDTEGNEVGQGLSMNTRLRYGMSATFSGVSLRTEWDLFDNQLLGDPWDIRGTEDARHRESVGVTWGSFAARRLSLGGRAGPVAMEGGIVTSHWGLGMLANDGAHDPEFGQTEFGDRVLRLRIGTRPVENVPLTLGLAGDRVLEDESAEWSVFEDGGEAAYQAIGSVMYGTPETGRYGIYGVYRDQLESDLVRHTQVGVVDLYTDIPVSLPAADLRFAFEGAGIFGTTDRTASYNSRDGLDVAACGMSALAEARVKPLDLRGLLRLGFASGDENPDDGTTSTFAFDRDFDVGLVMFDEFQGAIDAAAYAQLSDPEHAGGAPDGAEAIVGEGAFRQGLFVQPVVSAIPLKNIEVKVGVLLAWATAPISQAYATYRNGGVPANFLGEPTEGYELGSEIDWAVKLGDHPIPMRTLKLSPAILVQGGHYFASANLGGGMHHLVTGSARLRW